jgi:hypothetical protein
MWSAGERAEHDLSVPTVPDGDGRKAGVPLEVLAPITYLM